MRDCPHCGHPSEDGQETCERCGHPPPGAPAPAELARNPAVLTGTAVAGRYEVLELLGEGGMGIVYKVRHRILEHRNLFALKILHPRFSHDEALKKRFIREVEVAMNLAHEHVVQIREFGFLDCGLPFFTMDFIAGETLKSLLKREAPFAPERALAITRQILQALAAAHRARIVHRDLKPENVLVSRHRDREQVRILDFGIAKILEGGPGWRTLTEGGTIGTPRYMSPEQAAGEKVDGRSDLYSLGILTYEMLAGRTPFAGGTTRSILLAHLTRQPPPFKEVRPDLEIPEAVERFVFRLLGKEPGARPASAEECLALLEGRRAETTRSTLSLGEPGGRDGGHRRRVALASAAGALALTLVVGLFFFLTPRPPAAARRAPAGLEPGTEVEAEAAGATGVPGSEGGEAAAPGEAGAGGPPEREGGRDGSPDGVLSTRYRCRVCGEWFDEAAARRLESMHHALPLERAAPEGPAASR